MLLPDTHHPRRAVGLVGKGAEDGAVGRGGGECGGGRHRAIEHDRRGRIPRGVAHRDPELVIGSGIAEEARRAHALAGFQFAEERAFRHTGGDGRFEVE